MKPRSVLVTGAARGIGRATAALLAARGWRVAAADIEVAGGEAAARADGAQFFACDVADETAVSRCVAAVAAAFGGLDALVNNAGLTGASSGPVEQLSLEEWNRRIGVNLTGVFLMAKHCVPHLRAAKGAMVNVASTRALQSEPDTESYSASKGGVVALSHALAVSLGPAVRVNCVSPGWIDTRGSALRPEDHAQHPAGRVGRPGDIAETVAWLLSDAAGFVSGQNIVVDGGMTRRMFYIG